MTNISRDKVWHILYLTSEVDKNGDRDIVMYPKPHESPYPIKCTVEARIGTARAQGFIEFEAGKNGLYKLCFCEDCKQKFHDIRDFSQHLKEEANDRLMHHEANKMMRSEALWFNIDD